MSRLSNLRFYGCGFRRNVMDMANSVVYIDINIETTTRTVLACFCSTPCFCSTTFYIQPNRAILPIEKNSPPTLPKKKSRPKWGNNSCTESTRSKPPKFLWRRFGHGQNRHCGTSLAIRMKARSRIICACQGHHGLRGVTLWEKILEPFFGGGIPQVGPIQPFSSKFMKNLGHPSFSHPSFHPNLRHGTDGAIFRQLELIFSPTKISLKQSQTIHVWYIYLYIWLFFMVKYGKCR